MPLSWFPVPLLVASQLKSLLRHGIGIYYEARVPGGPTIPFSGELQVPDFSVIDSCLDCAKHEAHSVNLGFTLRRRKYIVIVRVVKCQRRVHSASAVNTLFLRNLPGGYGDYFQV